MNARNSLALLPNFITLARLLAVPVTVYLLLQASYAGAFWIFIAAGVSDALDGYLAKRLKLESEIGAYLDPLADKALIVSIYVTLGHLGHIAVWLVILVVFRDLLIIGGAILFHTITQSLKMDPLFVSKVNTSAQITLAGLVLGELGLGVPLGGLTEALVYLVGATTLISGGAYVVKWGWMAVMMERDK